MGRAARVAGQVLLGAFLVLAGTAHLTVARTFRAQVPPWLPVDADVVVVASGVVEIVLGAALLALWRPRPRVVAGGAVAVLFVAVFPGNVSQLLTRSDAFGLDSDASRAIRLLFQPLLVAWALWCTRAWAAWRSRRLSRR